MLHAFHSMDYFYTVMNKSLRPLEIITSFQAQSSMTLYLHFANCFISHLINHKYMEDSTIQSKQSYTKKCFDSQYFVWPPLFLITALILLGILSIKLWLYSMDISFTQTSFITFNNSAPLNGCFSDTLFFMLVHKFSIF